MIDLNRRPVGNHEKSMSSVFFSHWRRAALAPGLLSLCLLLAWPVLAAQEAEQSVQPVPEAEAVEPDSVDPEEAARLQALAARRVQLEQDLDDLRSEAGIYSPVLMEAYSDLGALYTELEDFDSAVQVYNDALQIARINNGLYSVQQLPLVESLIDTQQQRQDWQAVDDLAHLHLHLHERLYGATDTAYLDAALDYGAWKQRVINQNLLNQGSQARLGDARNLSQFYEQRLLDLDAAAEGGADIGAPRLLALLEGKSEADLTMARAVANTPYTYFSGNASRYVTETRCRNVTNAQGQLVRQCYQVQVENPRYRQSQRDAKRFELARFTREIERSLERMQSIQQADNGLNAQDRQQLEERIAALRTEAQQIRTRSRDFIRF